VVALPDGADAKGWYVSLSRARAAMHVYTRNKTALLQSVMQPDQQNRIYHRLSFRHLRNFVKKIARRCPVRLRLFVMSLNCRTGETTQKI
jgi:hypothetical protein